LPAPRGVSLRSRADGAGAAQAGLSAGPYHPYKVGSFEIALRSDTQTLARLSPMPPSPLQLRPYRARAERAGDGYNHIGDLNLRVRAPGGEWRDFASAHARKPIRLLAKGGKVIAAADITASMGADAPFRVERRWVAEGGLLVLRFVSDQHLESTPLEIGALGMPMVFDNIITDRNLDEAHAEASFVDPYIGRDAGYLQVTRLNGKGPALLVLPEKGSPLEAWAPLKNPREAKESIFTDKSQRGQTSEGFYDWTVHSIGYADREWKDAGEQWNAPTGRTLAPGQSIEVGVRMTETPSIRDIETTLIAGKRPVAVGIPGYVVPEDQTAALFVKAPSAIRKIESFPAGAIEATPAGNQKGWARVTLRGRQWGQVRLTLTYADGQVQTVSYFVTKPLEQTMADLGRFSTTKQWYEGKGDPFGRSPAILTYDNEAKKIVDVEPRVWIAGMSDEGGGGAWVAATMKQLDNPDAGKSPSWSGWSTRPWSAASRSPTARRPARSRRACSITTRPSSPISTRTPTNGSRGPRGRRRTRTTSAAPITIHTSRSGIGCSIAPRATTPAWSRRTTGAGISTTRTRPPSR
jgi:hypothetical protein